MLYAARALHGSLDAPPLHPGFISGALPYTLSPLSHQNI